MPKLFWPWWVLSCCFLSLLFLPVSSFSAPVLKGLMSPSETSSADQLTHPPLQQSFDSANYRFTIAAVDEWQTPTAVGQLYADSQLKWQRDLPHDYGPRFTVVSPAGQVLLVDEFINVASPNALTLFSTEGELIVRYGFEEIKQTLNVSAAELVAQADTGWWVSSPPQLSDQQDSVLIETGGTTIEINLDTGELLL